jgi:cell division protein FtsN
MGAAAAAAVVMIGVGVWSYTARGAQSAPAVHVESKPPLQLEPALDSPAPVAAVPTPLPVTPPAPVAPEPTPAVAAPPTPATLEMSASYELTVASFATPGRASTVASDLVANGHPARVAASGKWQIVIVGPYSSEPEAQDARRTIEQLGFAGIRIARVP